MFTLIKGAELYSPAWQGKQDVLFADGRILAAGDLQAPEGYATEVIDGTNKRLLPGLIDGHVHIIGGGGEGGYRTRTPELQLSDAFGSGITTVVGVIGTDGASRTMAELIVKARALEEEGLTCYAHVGNYHIPVRTVTGKIEDDLLLIDRIIGVGEVAISDHRSSQPSFQDLAKVASEARIGGMLSGKAGIVNVHIGDGHEGLSPLLEVVEKTELPISSFYPTHINRTENLFTEGLTFAKNGGVIDFTASTVPEFLADGEVKAPRAVRRALEAGVSPAAMTMTSDGQGSLPSFDASGQFSGLKVARVSALYEAVKEAILEEGADPESVLRTVTTTPANTLKLPAKGAVETNKDADLVLVDQDWEIDSVWAKGRRVVAEKTSVVKGTFETP
ncbi:beta-aspartyl-peptidase [Salisediminibacterium halotolerans]|uniref:beta-aspartyl-peptidase n=1 Tax=Salisediminibacterium halotolerans TaxID=517425 RepID=UPI000EB1BEE8|nr:beta-aspartyl-peptidase [Salisediminibacterium halotolerans]RLJ78286.1 beta-aspartyl-dipeptidase (metallo-type) [Actinophytocola xinjiangensis]RPE88375.1 beta-aspartyl-dipeptidase (metallo-type) [Salisediminibacterium halotolerans]TWG37263.1 beta-aspartyl-dipeptidase (metallo-type) [Salisediminibacterium halotolerans]GEL07743.1 isoaspartyl dipeptidase [Salisediminibacterium halotolerans]